MFAFILFLGVTSARECFHNETRIFYLEVDKTNTIFEAHRKCTKLGALLAEFWTAEAEEALKFIDEKFPQRMFFIGRMAVESQYIFGQFYQWYYEWLYLRPVDYNKDPWPWDRSIRQGEEEERCVVLKHGKPKPHVCSYVGVDHFMYGLCQLTISNKRYHNKKHCHWCLCPVGPGYTAIPRCLSNSVLCQHPCSKLIEGPACEQHPCRYKNLYGPPNCDNVCRCREGCDPKTGVCRGPCEPGWVGENCNKYVPKAKVDPSRCNCLGDYECGYPNKAVNDNDNADGRRCLKCASGAGGPICNDTECQGLYYGNDCGKVCHCKPKDGVNTRVMCSQITGQCSHGDSQGCEEGWRGLACGETKCSKGLFGPKCQYTCVCRFGNQCHMLSGKCPNDLCKDGWKGHSCNETACPVGSYGQFCTRHCEKCKKGEACDQNKGKCLSSHVIKRRACENNTWGVDCDTTCLGKVTGHCIGCDRDTGDKCGDCQDGYKLNADGKCQECPDYTYGFRCKGKCQESCPHSNGCNKFKLKCNPYNRCVPTIDFSDNSEFYTALIYNCIITAAAVLIYILVVSWMKYKKKKKEEAREGSSGAETSTSSSTTS